MNGKHITLITLIVVTMVAFMVTIFSTESDNNTMREMRELKQSIEQNNKRVDSIMSAIELRHDTITLIEKRQTLYTTKYINNEKVIITSNDSINDALYQQNKREFTKRWMSGRYAPTTTNR